MTPPDAYLSFILRFVQMDLKRLQPQEWRRLQQDIAGFVGNGWRILLSPVSAPLRIMPDKAFKQETIEDSIRVLQQDALTIVQTQTDAPISLSIIAGNQGGDIKEEKIKER